jgi:hypothetical protein
MPFLFKYQISTIYTSQLIKHENTWTHVVNEEAVNKSSFKKMPYQKNYDIFINV